MSQRFLRLLADLKFRGLEGRSASLATRKQFKRAQVLEASTRCSHEIPLKQ